VVPDAVVFDGAEYKLYFQGWDSNPETPNALGLAVSTDLETWEKVGTTPVLEALPGGWEVGGNCCAEILRDEDTGQYTAWYSGWVPGRPFCGIGVATSEDGVSWSKPSTEPVLRAELPWEEGCVDTPSIVFDGERYHLWYWAGWDTAVIGYATSEVLGAEEPGSEELRIWKKHPVPVLAASGDEGGIGSPAVLYDPESGLFEMWYTIYRNGRRGVGYATSLDGVTWVKRPDLQYDDGVSRRHGDPTVLLDGTTYRMFYDSQDELEVWRARVVTAPWTLPRASFSLEEDPVSASETDPLTVRLDASRSTSPTGEITSFTWDFGDGTQSEGREVSHVYALPGSYLVELTATDSEENTGRVARRVQVSLAAGKVDPWTVTDVGDPVHPGAAREEGDCISIVGAEGEIFGAADAFHYLYQKQSGDFSVRARVAGAALSSTGLMVRESLDAGARHGAVLLANDGRPRVVQVRREEVDGETRSNSRQAPGAEGWVRLDRDGDNLAGFWSEDGEAWEEIRLFTLAGLADEVHVGIASATRRFDPGDPNASGVTVASVCDVSLARATRFICGDCNGDGTVAGLVNDAVFLLRFNFLGGELPQCLAACDADGDGFVSGLAADAIFLLNHSFNGGSPPPLPFPGCGIARLAGDAALGCERGSAACDS